MQKHKILLIGKNNAMIDDFYSMMMGQMEIMTSSMRYEDIINHIKYVKPDAFVYCIDYSSKEKITVLMQIEMELKKEFVPFVIIGSETDCQNFEYAARNMADLVLVKPMRASMIEEKIEEAIRESKEEKTRLENLMEETMRGEKKVEVIEKKNILVVDDDATMLKSIKEQLGDDYHVATAINGKVALKFLDKKTPDLVLLDYEMPNENGSEVFGKIRANEKFKDLPVVFLTGVTERDKIKKVLLMKPQGYLVKPVEHEKLMAMIHKILG